MPETIFVNENRIIRGMRDHALIFVLCKFDLKETLSVKVFNIILFSFVDPKKNLGKTVICKVVIVRGKQALLFRVP